MALTIHPAWRLNDPTFERDALAFWQHSGALGRTVKPEQRVKELCTVAYAGDELVGVGTAAIRHIDVFNCRVAMFRCSVARESRMMHAATDLAVKAVALLEQWSFDNPQEKVLGAGAVVQSQALVDHERNMVWPDTKLAFVGYTAQGEQLRVRWFNHAMVPEPPPADRRAPINLVARPF